MGFLIILVIGCTRDIENLQAPSYPSLADVFIDDFTGDLAYAAFGGSDVKAFQVDNQLSYGGTKQSMRFEVPDANSPQGSYAGGVFFSKTGRNLSGYNALTFYIKGSQAATIGVVGLGNDLGESKYQVNLSNLTVNSNWKKVIIPIPDASKLNAEKGLFYYSAGPENGKGYTFWIDEVRFEKLGDLAYPQFMILNGQDLVETAFIGITKILGGLTTSFNLPNGINQTVNAAPAYFEFKSSNPTIATVNASGKISVIGGPGTSDITASVGGVAAKGSLKIDSKGTFQSAPIPNLASVNVSSIFSDTYTNIPVDYYNGYWQPYQTTLSADFEVNGDRILNYTDFNFVGIQFSSPTLNASAMTHFHADIFIPSTITGILSLE
ncbi:MAG: glycosyl hydrolase family 16 [Saprospiraceae bacterium]|nr:glycosyl hydrolase family 16 [Saprospiraceae bacterium]